MDELVKQAMAKWPNVPHCYGWLRLDARGHWRMRDERAQHLNLPGDKIVHSALLAFIARNYAADERGCWFFQNGPQRVYLQLEATPYIARTEPERGFALHTGAALEHIDQAWLCPSGELILCGGAVVAQLDDRDLGQAMALLELDGRAIDDEALLAWLENDTGAGALTLRAGAHAVPVQRIAHEALAAHFGFERDPVPI